jgi:hypothetical protein
MFDKRKIVKSYLFYGIYIIVAYPVTLILLFTLLVPFYFNELLHIHNIYIWILVYASITAFVYYLFSKKIANEYESRIVFFVTKLFSRSLHVKVLNFNDRIKHIDIQELKRLTNHKESYFYPSLFINEFTSNCEEFEYRKWQLPEIKQYYPFEEKLFSCLEESFLEKIQARLSDKE